MHIHEQCHHIVQIEGFYVQVIVFHVIILKKIPLFFFFFEMDNLEEDCNYLFSQCSFSSWIWGKLVSK